MAGIPRTTIGEADVFYEAKLAERVIWAAWQAPDIILGNYDGGTNRWYALGCLTIMATSVGFMLNWMTLKSGSLWPAALLHASQNLFVQGIFDPLTRDTGQSRWYATSFGIALVPITVAFAVYFWTRCGEADQFAGHRDLAKVVTIRPSTDKDRPRVLPLAARR